MPGSSSRDESACARPSRNRNASRHRQRDQVVHIEIRRRQHRAAARAPRLSIRIAARLRHSQAIAAAQRERRRCLARVQASVSLPPCARINPNTALQAAEFGAAFGRERLRARGRHPLRRRLAKSSVPKRPTSERHHHARRSPPPQGEGAPCAARRQRRWETAGRDAACRSKARAARRRAIGRSHQRNQRAADQRRGEKAVLPDDEVAQHGGKRRAPADNRCGRRRWR